MKFTLNDFVWIAWICGTAINWLVPEWQSTIRKTLANFFIVLMAWFITEFLITATPIQTWGQVIYVLLLIAFSASPIDIYHLVTFNGKKILATKIEQVTDTINKEETKPQ